jgi:hypothetical protein
MSEADLDRPWIEEWADRYGSGRLRRALEGDKLPRRLYLEERASSELPGFEVDFDGSFQLEAVGDPDEVSTEALGSVVEEVEASDIAHMACDVVLRTVKRDGRPAVRIQGWEDGLTAVGYVVSRTGSVLIDSGFPFNVPGRGEPPLRPTAYASAYGVRHPAAQEALRSAAVVQVDLTADSGEYELEELLPPDARDLIDDALAKDMADTVYLVGWKLGQPRHHRFGSFAEQVACFLLIGHAESTLDRPDFALSAAGLEQARKEIDDLRESVLDEMFLHEYLPSVDAYRLADLVPAGVESRLASLWAPWYRGVSEPPPRATGDDEPDWSLSDGQTPRQAEATGGAERSEEAEQKLEATAADFADLQWRLEFHRRDPHLLADMPDGGVHSFRPPPALFGAGPAAAPWAWAYGRYPSRDAAVSSDVEPDGRESLSWPDFFRVFPEPSHPLAVDAVFNAVEMAAGWVGAVGGHALPGGAVEPFERSAQALEGIVALREELEKCRAAGLVRDDRLTRRGIRHELFGRGEAMRFVTEARFAPEPGSSFDEVQSEFNQTIYDFSPLPISLGIEPHEDGDGSVIVRCAMGVDEVEEAFDLAQEVISQILWRVGLQPIDLAEGEEVDEVGFEITDLEERGEEEPED